MPTIPKPTKYARRHKDGRILCYRQRCGFTFGEVGADGIAYVDGGFVESERAAAEHGVLTSRQLTRSDREQHGPYALTTRARHAYETARAERTVAGFRALARHGAPARAWPLMGNTEIVCPEHGLQHIDLVRLGAIPAPSREYMPGRDEPATRALKPNGGTRRML